MLKRKHRFYIDVTYSNAIEMRKAAKGLQLVIDRWLDVDDKPVWLTDNSPFIDKVIVTEMRHPVTRP